MDDRSRIDRTVVSDFGNIRDEENEDDNEFFAPINGSETESCESPAAEHGNHNSVLKEYGYVGKENVPQQVSTASSGASTSKGGVSFHQRSIISEQQQQPSAASNLASNRYANNLSKITEAAEEFSFSFKHGDSARRILDENQELLRDENYLRLPDSFHASQYSAQNSWDAGSRSPFNFSARPELDLSVILVQEKATSSVADNSQNRSGANTSTASPQHSSTTQKAQPSFTGRFFPNTSANPSNSKQQHKSTSLSKQQQNSSLATGYSFSQADHASATELPKSFITGNRHSVFFGFRRPDFSAEEILIIRNNHPEGKPIQISCMVMSSHKNCFKLDYPDEKVVRDLQWDSAQRIVIHFTPKAVNYFKAALYIQCSDPDGKKQKLNFLLHGYGGRAIVNPYMEDRFGGRLLVSSNGRCQLIVRSLSKFDFGLKNLSADRTAFACLLIQGRTGAELSPQEVWASPRHVVLGKQREGGKSTQTINIRYLLKEKEGSTPRPSSAFSTATSTIPMEPALKIIVIWGEERMRQRLKQFEKKKGQRLAPFGFDFLTQETFLEEEEPQEENLHVNEEDLFYLVKNMKLCFIDVYQNPQERPSSSSGATTGSSLGRVGSALSIASSSGLDMRAHQTIIEVDPDNTMVGNPVNDEDQDDDTLTQT